MKPGKLLFIALTLIIFLAGCTAKEQPALRIGVIEDSPPFCSFVDGSLVGIDVDIAHNIARILESPYEISAMPKHQIETDLLDGRLDLGLIALTINDTRPADLSYSLAYHESEDEAEEAGMKKHTLVMPSDLKQKDAILAALDDLVQSGDLVSILQTHEN